MGKKGKIMKGRWLPYSFAKAALVAVKHKPSSRKGWFDWWDLNQPAGIPKNPDKVYLEDWTSWNDWLGNENEFVIKEKGDWKEYFAAMKYVHSRKFENKPAYREAVLQDDWPVNIPRSPQVVYKEWDSWSTWLGVTLRSRIKVMEEIEQCLALCSIAGQSHNIIQVIIAKGGLDELKAKLESAQNLTVYRLYVWDPEMSENVGKLFEHACTEQGDSQYHVHHMHSLTFELDTMLMLYRAKG